MVCLLSVTWHGISGLKVTRGFIAGGPPAKGTVPKAKGPGEPRACLTYIRPLAPEQRKQENDRKRDTEHPEKRAFTEAHHLSSSMMPDNARELQQFRAGEPEG